MTSQASAPLATASIVIPAHNEESSIRRLLASILSAAHEGEFEVVVVCNGCTDNTAAAAREFPVTVLEVPEPSKYKALKSGDEAATAFPRLYIDADVEVSTQDVRLVVERLTNDALALAAAPERVLDLNQAGLLVRSYYHVWSRLPQVRSALFGRGVVAVSAAGFHRISGLESVLSDDLAMSEAFAPAERAVVSGARVVVHPPRTLRDLIRRRTRVQVGNAQLDQKGGRADESRTSISSLGKIVRADPKIAVLMPVFVGVTLISKLRAKRQIRAGDFSTWQRDESSRAPAPRDQSPYQGPIWTPSEPGVIDIAVVIVTYNSSEVVDGLLDSLPSALEGLTWEIIAADNASKDDTLAVINASERDVRVVEMGRNAGYAAGINAALVAAPPPTVGVLVLNPDVRLAPGSVKAMQAALSTGVGIVVPRVEESDGEPTQSLRREPTIKRSIGDAVLGAQRAGRFPAWGEVVVDRDSYRKPTVADWAAGMAMLISRECLDACGPWDESFFLYSEETEYCLRARDAGFALVLAPDAVAAHLGGDSRVSPQLRALVIVNRVRLYARGHSRLAGTLFWSVAVTREVSRALLGRKVSRQVLPTLISLRRMRRAPRAASGS